MKVIYITFGFVLVVVEEVLFATEIYNNIRKIQERKNLLKGSEEGEEPIKYEELSEDEQNALFEFYKSVDNLNRQRMMLMARESSIQLVYQKALTPFIRISAQRPGPHFQS